MTFQTNNFELQNFSGQRRRGRPRLNWNHEIHKHALKVSGTTHAFANDVRDKDIWSDKIWHDINSKRIEP